MQYKNLTIVEAPAGNIRKVEIVWLGGLTMGQWYGRQQDKPTYMINGSLWDGAGAIGTIWCGGTLVRNEGGGYGFGTTPAGWAWGAPWDKDWRDYISGTPALLREGKATGAHMPLRADEIVRTKRSAIAGAGGSLYLITADGLTLAQFTEQLQDFGAYYAINLDGGGSSRLLVDGKAINSPTDDRRCPNAIAIWLKEDKPSKGENNNMKSIYLSPSTQEHNMGAGNYGTEERRMNEICDIIENELRGKYILYRNRPEMTLQQVVADSNAKAPDVHVAIHSNAGGARGCEALICAKGGQAEKLAGRIYTELAALTPTSDRGVKVNAALYEVNKTKAPAVIVEVEFHDNEAGAAWIVANKAAIARAIVRGIMLHFGDTPPAAIPANGATEKWYAKELAEAVAAGITDGTRPDDPATRAEVAVMVLRGVRK